MIIVIIGQLQCIFNNIFSQLFYTSTVYNYTRLRIVNTPLNLPIHKIVISLYNPIETKLVNSQATAEVICMLFL